MRAAVVVILVIAVAACVSAWADEELVPLSFGESSPEASLPIGHGTNKRSFYNSCNAFDRELIGRLNRVCDDCYNVYRDSSVAVECRSNCFRNPTFFQCLEYLFPIRIRHQYRAAMQTVGK